MTKKKSDVDVIDHPKTNGRAVLVAQLAEPSDDHDSLERLVRSMGMVLLSVDGKVDAVANSVATLLTKHHGTYFTSGKAVPTTFDRFITWLVDKVLPAVIVGLVLWLLLTYFPETWMHIHVINGTP